MTSLAAVVIATSAILGQVGNQQASNELKGLQPMVGKWFIDDTPAPADFPELGLKKDESVKRFAKLKSEMFDSIITFEIVVQGEGQPEVLVWRETIAWDPDVSAVTCTAIGYTKEMKSRYVYAKGNWKSDGESLKVSYAGVMGDGNKISWKTTFTIGKDGLKVEVTDRVRGGERLDDQSIVYKRVAPVR